MVCLFYALQGLLADTQKTSKSNMTQLDTDSRHLSTRYHATEPKQLYTTLDMKYSEVTKHLSESVDMWATHASCHTDYDEQVSQCQAQLRKAEKFDEIVCNNDYKLQSQLLLEAKVKV